MQGGSPAVLGMPDIDILGILTISCETIGKQVASDKNTDDSKRNCQCKRAVQTEGGKFESYKNKKAGCRSAMPVQCRQYSRVKYCY